MTAPPGIETTERAAPPAWRIVSMPHTLAAVLWLLSVLVLRQPLMDLANLSFQDENSSHILLIPLISASLLYWRRKQMFQTPSYSPFLGTSLLVVTGVLWYGLQTSRAPVIPRDRLSAEAAVTVLAWTAIFLLCYGVVTFRKAIFPLLFLFLMVPLTLSATKYTVSVLQRGSADTCYMLFRILRMPVLRHGFQFSLPGVDIEVAEQCSGIHSCLSLLIAGLVAAEFLLPGAWKKICFTLCIVPIAILKNAIRIVTITWLGIHVNQKVFEGPIHRQGGLPFSLIAVAMMGVLLWVLKRRSVAGVTDGRAKVKDHASAPFPPVPAQQMPWRRRS